MKIAGINTNSFVDMKGMIAYVIFTAGCNLNCWYCHNRHIIGDTPKLYNPDKVLSDIESRAGFIDIVVISGGEPTLQEDLIHFIKEIKKMDFRVKLDTNGTRPEVIEYLLTRNLIDYIAMDIKASKAKYPKTVCVDTDYAKISRSIEVIMGSGIDYEFRTTFTSDLDERDILEIAEEIQGARLYVLQQFVPHDNMLKKVVGPHLPSYIKKTAEKADKYVKTIVRGLGVG